jgi:hypothetical protein
MGVQSFDEKSLTNGPVPQTGTKTSATPASPPSATGTPSAVEQADGTANLGTTATTKQAPNPSVPVGKKGPSGVDSYSDGVV